MFSPKNINLSNLNYSSSSIKTNFNNTYLNEGFLSERKQNLRLNKLLYYLSQYDPIIDGSIEDYYDTSNIDTLIKHYYSFESLNEKIQKNLIKKKWSLFKDFNFLLCLFANLDKNTQNSILNMFKIVKDKLNNKYFSDVCECGNFIFENFKNISVLNNNKFSKNGIRFLDLRIISYMYFYNYHLMRIKITNKPIKNTYFRVNNNINSNNLRLETNIKHINDEIYIWKSNTEQNIIIIFRGTNISVFDSLVRDIRSDIGIFLNKYHNINTLKYGNRLQYSVELYIFLSKIYNNFTFTLSGHSLGGTTVHALNEYIGIKNLEINGYESPVKLIKKPCIVYAFNPGTTIFSIKKLKSDYSIKNINNNVILILSNKTDPISNLNKYLNRKIIIFYINSPIFFHYIKFTHELKYIDDIRYNILTLYKLYNANNSIFNNTNINISDSHSRLFINKIFKLKDDNRENFHNREIIRTLF